MKDRTRSSRLLGCACLLFALGFHANLTLAQTTVLEIEARDNVPSPVEIEVEGINAQGGQTFVSTEVWDLDNNNWRTLTLNIPDTTRGLVFTFKNDACRPGCPGDQDADRNAYIDGFTVYGVRREAELFDETGGPDPRFPGCQPQVVDNRLVVTCGNDEDYVAYDLSFAQCDEGTCTALGENYTAQENNHVNILDQLGVFSQSFTPTVGYTLCEVGVRIDPGLADCADVDVSLESPPGTVLASNTIVRPLDHRFYYVPMGPVGVVAGQTYFIRLSSNVACLHRWCAMVDTTDPYPNGAANAGGVPIPNTDFLFATFHCSEAYGSSVNRPVDFDASGEFVPGAIITLTARTPASMLLKKRSIIASVELLEASIDIAIDDAIETDAEESEFSRFRVIGGEGQFDAYLFDDVPIGVSTFTLTGGKGSILWTDGGVLSEVEVTVNALGFTDIVAVAAGSGQIDFESGTVRMSVDGTGAELLAQNHQFPGDCNQDGAVNVSDAVCLFGHLFLASPASLPCDDGAKDDPGNVALLDCNGDGNVDISDGVWSLGFLFLGTDPPVLGTHCQPIVGCPEVCRPQPEN